VELLKKGATVVFATRSEQKTTPIINSLDEKLKKKICFYET